MKKKMSRRYKTKKDLSKDNRCRVFFIFGYDDTSHYIKFDYGKGTHKFHLICNFKKNVSNTSKILNDKHLSIMRICDKYKAITCTGADIINVSGEY